MRKSQHWGVIALIAVFLLSLASTQRAEAQTRRRTTTTATRNNQKNPNANPVDKPYTGYNKQPAGKAVDLGLSVLWADRNVGAANPGDEGGLFHWGSATGLIGKFAEHEMKPTGMPEIFSSRFDTAHMAWGGDWRMPSVEDFIELFTVCKMSMTVDKEGYSMLRLTGPNGNSITLPMTGAIHWPGNQELKRDYANHCCYWTGETNRDTIGMDNGRIYKMKPSFYSDPNEPMYAEFVFPLWPTWAMFRPDLDRFSIKSIASCNRETWAMAVRPVMDRDGLPRPATYESCKEILDSKGKRNYGKNPATRKPAGGQNGNKNNGKYPPAETKKQQPHNNGKPNTNGNSNSANNNKQLIPNHNYKDRETERRKQTGNDRPQESGNGYDEQQPKDAPIPTPRPEPEDTIPQRRGTIAQERAVDLGLSVYWSDRNIGARSISDPGDYFCWGMKEAKERKKQEINTKGIPYYVGNINGTEYDIATAHWSARWRMPTKEEIQELIDNCTFELDSINGQKGMKIIGKNKNWIFLPLAGSRNPVHEKEDKDETVIWSADEFEEEFPIKAYSGVFTTDGKTVVQEILKGWLSNVRPVTKRLLHQKQEKR